MHALSMIAPWSSILRLSEDEHARLARRYAELVIRVGANVTSGQHVFIQSTVENASFARAITAAAYDAGAAYVDVHYRDDVVRRSFIEAADDETLMYSPPWLTPV